ncbi:hypothetical protein EFV37_35850 (plasmid) [Mesorhizobium loti]|uniref:Uncharacterized protein n=1 Tax=Mesorhizobium jarvisii TaxID=1777867 RepID=A0A6M7TX24_9HYPH|nr:MULTISPECIES: MobQ family relaxase [Mesorhizobium]OBQ66499.1 hypothetical protein A9K72_34685 [Mesorhizobium loti]QKC67647.1 hypothetical protein EB229_35805 [Mesorhizobium jarvisii]QKD13568.1 hypothetical protein EFV37_35850 [Mesorhizobium loti]RJT28193.1 hypothetical protein D3242_33050 [Mesorhizobium jarvisii]
MAIYHFSGQVLGRTSKRNPDGSWRPGSKVVAAAAYRSGERLDDAKHRETHDYSRRHGVVHAEILTPPGSAPWLGDRQLLWNTVEAMEERKDAQLAREFNMALPFELSHEDRVELVRDFAEIHFVRRGMVADIALHNPNPEDGQSEKNFHAHMMLTMRRATASGLDPVKTREWNSKELLKTWRAEWELACNRALERAGKKTRIDHRTLVAQRDAALAAGDRARAAQLNRAPEIHVGPRARQMARQGRPPASQVREVGAYRKKAPAAPAKRRERDYPSRDSGTRLSFLEKILSGNNEQYRRNVKAINHRFDRMSRKVDYWQRRATFYAEGKIMGKEFRFNRWKAADAAKQSEAAMRQRAAHARKRLQQLESVMKLLEGILTTTTRRREIGLVRVREVEGWIRSVRSRGRPSGRGRRR